MIRALAAALLLALVANITPSRAEAQPADGFSSDRPGYSNSTSAAPVLRPILEMGAGFTFDEDDPETVSAPNFLVRFGLSEWLELRLAIPSVVGIFVPDPGDNGVAFGDTTIGLKVAVSPTESFSSSIVPSLSIATEGGVNTGRIEWNWAVALGAVSIGGNLALRAKMFDKAVGSMSTRPPEDDGEYAPAAKEANVSARDVVGTLLDVVFTFL